MITDEQVQAACRAYYGEDNTTNYEHYELVDMRKTLEAYEQSKWVKFDVDDDSSYPQKTGHHLTFDGRYVSHRYWNNTGENKRDVNQAWFVSTSVTSKKATHWQPLPTFKE